MVQTLEPQKKRTKERQKSFFERYRLPIIGGGVVVAVLIGFLVFGDKGGSKRKASANVVSISMPPLPPPPPPQTPPPQQEPPPQAEEKQPEFQEAEPEPVQAPEPEAAPMGTDIQGDGPADGFGLSGKGGGGLIGGKGNGTGGGGSKWGAYPAQVQSRVVEAIRNHRKTRSADLNLKVRIWVDTTGRITKVTLQGASKDASVDEAIKREVLGGMQLSSPPPEGMPMPIVLRIHAKRPQ